MASLDIYNKVVKWTERATEKVGEEGNLHPENFRRLFKAAK